MITLDSQRHHRGYSAFPRKRLVKSCTKRFRGNVTDVTNAAMAGSEDAPSASEEYARSAHQFSIARGRHSEISTTCGIRIRRSAMDADGKLWRPTG